MSKQPPVFPVKEMIDLLKNIDENVRQIVYSLRERGAEVRKKVVDLLNTYMELLTEVLGECASFENTIGILQRRLQGAKDTLTLVLKHKVNKILTDLDLDDVDEYKKHFDIRGLKRAYQLMKDDFRVEHLELPESKESETVKDRIIALRRDFKDIEGVIKEVKKMGEKREQSCKDIAEKFKTFQEDISKTRDGISTLLGELPLEEKALIVNQIIAGVAAAACIVGFFIGAAYWYATGPATAVMVKVATPLSGLGGGVAGAVCWYTGEEKKEMEKVEKALKEVQNKLDEMKEAAGKQKTDWENVVIQVKKIVDQVNTSNVEKTAENLDPSHSTPVKEVLQVIKVVLKDSALLKANMIEFKKEAERVQGNLRDLSVTKKTSDVVLATPGGTPRSVFEPIWGFVRIAEKMLSTWFGERR